MRTEHECLAMAAERRSRAECGDTPERNADLLQEATVWDYLARQAKWQDEHPHRPV
jgi:hypothetical protein